MTRKVWNDDWLGATSFFVLFFFFFFFLSSCFYFPFYRRTIVCYCPSVHACTSPHTVHTLSHIYTTRRMHFYLTHTRNLHTRYTRLAYIRIYIYVHEKEKKKKEKKRKRNFFDLTFQGGRLPHPRDPRIELDLRSINSIFAYIKWRLLQRIGSTGLATRFSKATRTC